MARHGISRREFNWAVVAGVGTLIAAPWLGAAGPATRGEKREDFGDVFAAEGLPFVPGSFTIAALPDTQHYSRMYHDHYYAITKWIAENKERRNIQFVAHLGDITNNNIPQQWTIARKAMATLDGVVPYSLICGNHDHGKDGHSDSRQTYLNDYFKMADYQKQATFGGVMEKGRIESSYHTFSAMGKDFLVLGLEWARRDGVIQWADEIVRKHPEHRVLLTTHAYMYFDDTRYDYKKYGKKQEWSPHTYPPGKDEKVNDGQEIWDKLVSKHPGFFMTLNGHVLNDGLGRMTSAGEKGNDVHQMLVNYQDRFEGGEGFFRLIEFLPDGKTVQVKAYSPSTNTYKVDAQNQFVLKLNPGLI